MLACMGLGALCADGATGAPGALAYVGLTHNPSLFRVYDIGFTNPTNPLKKAICAQVRPDAGVHGAGRAVRERRDGPAGLHWVDP